MKKKEAVVQADTDADDTEDNASKKGAGDSGDVDIADIQLPGAGGHKGSKKKLIIILGIVLVAGAAAAGMYFSGVLSKPQEKQAVELGPDGRPIEKAVFYNLPEFLVNLNSQGKAASFLKASVVIEVAHPSDVPMIESNLPRVVDALNTYLRELHPSDLTGSAGIQRLREEMLLRVNKALVPIKVNDVLFKEIIVQ